MIFMEKLGKNIAKYCFTFFVIVYALANIFFTVRQYNVGNNYAHYLWGLTPVNIILVVLLLGIIYFYLRKARFKINNTLFLGFFLIACLAVGLYWIFSNYQELVTIDDALNCFRSALAVSNGDYSPFYYGTYINTYPHNLTLISYFMLFTNRFGQGAIKYIRLLNLAAVLIGYLSLYGIGKRLFKNEKADTILILLMFLSMQLVFYAFFVYGNAVSYSFALLSVFLFIIFMQKEKVRYLVLAGAAILFAVFIKSNSLIILVAEIIYLLLYIISKKKWLYTIAVILLIVGQYAVTTGVVKYWENRLDTDYSNSLPTICWIAYGFNYNENTPGGYTTDFETYHHENGYVREYTETHVKEFINGVLTAFKERPWLIPRFYAQKFLVSFANSEYETFAQYRELPQSPFNESVISGDINDTLNQLWDAASTVIAIGLLAYIIKRFKKITLLELIGGVIVFGGFLFHMFWEVKAIYTYQYFMYLLPYAAYGLVLLFGNKGEESL